MKSYDYSTYLSPFTWRYGSDEMRQIWSEIHKRQLWRKIWVALARAQAKENLISQEELDDLIVHEKDIDIDKAHEIEKEIKHDLMAEITVYAQSAKIGGGKIHVGATSMDIEDNTDALRIQESLLLLKGKLLTLLKNLQDKIDEYDSLVCMGYTHLQPAEPITLGYRFAMYAQDVIIDLETLEFATTQILGKGMKGAVGTSASYVQLVGAEKAQALEEDVVKELGLKIAAISNQTGPRKVEHIISSTLSSIAQTIYNMAFDVRILQSPGFGEISEAFGAKQIGSSAMPFKRNPIKSEQMCSLARFVIHLATVPGDNAAHMLLERTLDDSANRRVVLPELFLAVDDILGSAATLIANLNINTAQIEKNLSIHGPFAATEVVMLEATKRGGNRQDLHEAIRENSLKAYDSIQKTGVNPLLDLLEKDSRITKYIPTEELVTLLDPTHHVGLSTKRCKDLSQRIQSILV